MTLAHVYTVAFEGVEAREVDVQVHIGDGMLAVTVVGLADKSVAESSVRARLTACGYHRVLRVARTIADLAGAERVSRVHIAEALSYRRLAHAG